MGNNRDIKNILEDVSWNQGQRPFFLKCVTVSINKIFLKTECGYLRVENRKQSHTHNLQGTRRMRRRRRSTKCVFFNWLLQKTTIFNHRNSGNYESFWL